MWRDLLLHWNYARRSNYLGVLGVRATVSKIVRYHDYIDEKIESTRRMVKVVDLATALVELLSP